MPNCYFAARATFVSGARLEAAEALSNCIGDIIGVAAFKPDAALLQSKHLSTFDVAVALMLSDPRSLRASFGGPFSVLWELHPADVWISTLLGHDFYADLNKIGWEADLAAVVEGLAGFDEIVQTLEQEAVNGLLCPDDLGPYSGRHTLRLNDIREVSTVRWGPLKAMLLDRLPPAYAACPPDFWNRLVGSSPEEVLFRALHELFLDSIAPIHSASLRWRAITSEHPEYATAVLDSLGLVLEKNHPASVFTDVARIDAGFSNVTDGSSWIAALNRALRSGDFGVLEEHV